MKREYSTVELYWEWTIVTVLEDFQGLEKEIMKRAGFILLDIRGEANEYSLSKRGLFSSSNGA